MHIYEKTILTTKMNLHRITGLWACYRSFLFALITAYAILTPTKAFATPPPALSSDVETATAGYFQLKWNTTATNPSEFILQESASASFSTPITRYQGSDSARVVSGKSDGDYFYRVSILGSDNWSDTVKVVVKHHSLQRAALFFFLGLIIFIGTLIVIKRGSKNN